MENSWQRPDFKIGILGGGQLGRMIIQEAINYNIKIHILDADPNAPCSFLTPHFTLGNLNDHDAVVNFGRQLDVITVEIENVSISGLKELQSMGKKVFPQPDILELIKDKGLQKEFYRLNQLPTADFKLLESGKDLLKDDDFSPVALKLRTGGYDGKGVQIIRNREDVKNAFDGPCVAEKLIPFVKELSVLVARNESGQTKAYPVVECEFNSEANLVEFLFSPADISESIEKRAEELAMQVIERLGMVGLLAVELFLLESGELLINEIAPRPHNSGHHTIECNVTSQFEQHLRAVIDLPLGETKLVQGGVMVNILGSKGYSGPAVYLNAERLLQLPGVHLHLYGKKNTTPFRKMGHVTITGDDMSTNKIVAKKVLKELLVIAEN